MLVLAAVSGWHVIVFAQVQLTGGCHFGEGRSWVRAVSRKEKLENQDWIKPALILVVGRMRRANTGICVSSLGSCFQTKA